MAVLLPSQKAKHQKQSLVLNIPGDKKECVQQVDKLGEEIPPGEGKDAQRIR